MHGPSDLVLASTNVVSLLLLRRLLVCVVAFGSDCSLLPLKECRLVCTNPVHLQSRKVMVLITVIVLSTLARSSQKSTSNKKKECRG